MSEPVDAEDGPTSGPRAPGGSSSGPEDPVAAPSDDDLAYQQRLGARLRAIRRSQGLRLQDVETRSAGRFKAVVVGSYERGDRAVSAHRLAALAVFYEVPVSELLPDDHWPRSNARGSGVRLAVDRLRAASPDPELAPLHRLVQHVQWLRGDYNGRVLSLRGDDLQTVAIALGIDPDELGGWLAERDLLAAV
jgi:transcriptional regulator with XRE-family HTH domain